MSRHSYKWDTIHVQRGAVACGDQEPASRGGGGREQPQLYSSNGPWAILLLTYYIQYSTALSTRTVRGDTDLRVDHRMDF